MKFVYRNIKVGKFFLILALLTLFWSIIPASLSQPIHALSLIEQTRIKTEQQRTEQLRDALAVDGIMQHLRALQAIADEHGNNRAAGTPGHRASVKYLVSALEAANYDVTLQPFTFDGYVEVTDPTLSTLDPNDAQFNEREYATR